MRQKLIIGLLIFLTLAAFFVKPAEANFADDFVPQGEALPYYYLKGEVFVNAVPGDVSAPYGLWDRAVYLYKGDMADGQYLEALVEELSYDEDTDVATFGYSFNIFELYYKFGKEILNNGNLTDDLKIMSPPEEGDDYGFNNTLIYLEPDFGFTNFDITLEKGQGGLGALEAYVHILSADGLTQPQVGARVQISDFSGITDIGGYCIIDPVFAGRHLVTAEKNGFRPTDVYLSGQGVEIFHDQTTSVDIYMVPEQVEEGRILVRVLNEDNVPLGNVGIIVSRSDNPSIGFSNMTDSNGISSFPLAAPANYNLTVTPGDISYNSVVLNDLAILPGRTRQETVILTEAVTPFYITTDRVLRPGVVGEEYNLEFELSYGTANILNFEVDSRGWQIRHQPAIGDADEYYYVVDPALSYEEQNDPVNHIITEKILREYNEDGLNLYLSWSSFALTGIPANAGTYVFTVEAYEDSDPEVKTQKEFEIIISEAGDISEDLVPLGIERIDDGHIKLTWDAANEPNPQIFMLSYYGDTASGVYENVYDGQWWLVFADGAVVGVYAEENEFQFDANRNGELIHQNQIGQGYSEAYYKAVGASVPYPEVDNAQVLEAAPAVGKNNVGLFVGGYNQVSFPFSYLNNQIKDVLDPAWLEEKTRVFSQMDGFNFNIAEVNSSKIWVSGFEASKSTDIGAGFPVNPESGYMITVPSDKTITVIGDVLTGEENRQLTIQGSDYTDGNSYTYFGNYYPTQFELSDGTVNQKLKLAEDVNTGDRIFYPMDNDFNYNVAYYSAGYWRNEFDPDKRELSGMILGLPNSYMYKRKGTSFDWIR